MPDRGVLIAVAARTRAIHRPKMIDLPDVNQITVRDPEVNAPARP